MDLSKAKQEFNKYVQNFDQAQYHVDRKINHSYRVMDLCEQIARSLNLTQSQIEVASLIGLLHDIAKIKQFAENGYYKGGPSIDHGDAGAEMLKKDNYIRNYIEDDSYDSIICASIRNHNKFEIESNLTDKELLFAKLIRDADKIDILYQASTILWSKQPEAVDELENSIIEESFLLPFYEKRKSNKKSDFGNANKTLKRFIAYISFVFDINYEISLEILKEKDYVNKFIDRFNFKDPISRERLEIIRKSVNDYLG